jgi:alcohol dehydrogenase
MGPYPITVDASGAPDSLALALRCTAPDGTCTSTAIYFDEQPALPLLQMYTKGVTFKTGRVHAREAMPHVLELAESVAIDTTLVTTRVVAWDDAPQALAEGDWTKLVIERP